MKSRSEDLNDDKIQRAFEQFHEAHPDVYRFFDGYVRQMLRLGHKRGSAALIFERIRWDREVENLISGSPKLNNNFRSRYARLWEEKNPEHAGFFKKRKLKPISANSTRRVDPIYNEE